jgi:ferredoxin
MKFISEANLRLWLGKLMRDRAVFAPVKGPDETVLFQPLHKAEDAVLDSDSTTLSPKQVFFPSSESIFSVTGQGDAMKIQPAVVEKDRVLFGLHPCDAQGISLVDKPFLAEPADLLYQERRERTALVGMSCRRACPECFCTSMGSGPRDRRAVDVLLTPADGGYAVDVVTDKGKAVLATAAVDEKEVILPASPEVPIVNAGDVSEGFKKCFDDPYWARVGDRCLSCNVCAYVCPTCYCFDMRDYTDHGLTERVRTWDSCQSPGWTRAAGGHNPRPGKGARMRQRFAHKLLYFPEAFGSLKCTGCGRCVRQCPVNIDIREIITDVRKLGGVK